MSELNHQLINGTDRALICWERLYSPDCFGLFLLTRVNIISGIAGICIYGAFYSNTPLLNMSFGYKIRRSWYPDILRSSAFMLEFVMPGRCLDLYSIYTDSDLSRCAPDGGKSRRKWWFFWRNLLELLSAVLNVLHRKPQSSMRRNTRYSRRFSYDW